MIRSAAAAAVAPPVSRSVALFLLSCCVFLTVGCLVSSNFAQQTVAGLASGAIYASLAVALVLIYRATEVINFAQGAMAMFTTYIAFQLMEWGLSYWPAFVATLAIAFAGGIATEVSSSGRSSTPAWSRS